VNHVLGLIERITGRPVRVQREPNQKGDMRDTFADTTRARTELAFAPSRSLETGLAAESRWIARMLAVPQA
jgi:nucleoside-diphosphate-sugar epimerase